MYGYALERGRNSTSSDNHSNHLTVPILKNGTFSAPELKPADDFTRIPNYLDEIIILSWLARQFDGPLQPLFSLPSQSSLVNQLSRHPIPLSPCPLTPLSL